MSGDEHQRRSRAGSREMALNVETTHAPQSHVHDQAGDVTEPGEGDDVFGRTERLDPEAQRPQQAPDRHADRRVVVDDRYGSLVRRLPHIRCRP